MATVLLEYIKNVHLSCPFCGGKVVANGHGEYGTYRARRYKCKDCGRTTEFPSLSLFCPKCHNKMDSHGWNSKKVTVPGYGHAFSDPECLCTCGSCGYSVTIILFERDFYVDSRSDKRSAKSNPVPAMLGIMPDTGCTYKGEKISSCLNCHLPSCRYG